MRFFGNLVCGVLLFPTVSFAQVWPESFRVQGVAAQDVLNIRAEPGPEAAIVGAFGPYDLNIEVLGLSEDGAWGKVGIPEGNGWVSMRFLQVTPAPVNEVPRPFACFGTEPFWSISFHPRGAIDLSVPGESPVALTLAEQSVAQGQWGGYLLRLGQADDSNHTLMVTREACSDGMSDREFGFSVLRMEQGGAGASLTRGCCTLDQR